jgi:predicted RecA/RadA family phage recombinase
MAKNFVQDGDLLTVTAPAVVKSGDLVKVGNIAGVAIADAASGDQVTLKTTGVWSLGKTSAQAWAEGEQVYLLSNGKVANASAAGAQLVGVAVAVAANPSAEGLVRLNGVSLPTAAT